MMSKVVRIGSGTVHLDAVVGTDRQRRDQEGIHVQRLKQGVAVGIQSGGCTHRRRSKRWNLSPVNLLPGRDGAG